MNEPKNTHSYAAMIAENGSHAAPDLVQQTLDALEQSGRDLRNVTLDEFKTLLVRQIGNQTARAEHLIGC